MQVHEIKLTGYQARTAAAAPLNLGTAGSMGNEQLHVTLGEGWEGLAVRAVFRPCRVSRMVPEDGVVDVPWPRPGRWRKDAGASYSRAWTNTGGS